MGWNLRHVISFTLLFLTGTVWAQTLVDEAKAPLVAANEAGVFNETIKIISASKKIFILTNNNQQLGTGDFISLALGNSLAARALVAKTHDGQVGIKILRIYSLKQWSLLKRGIEVQIIRGDDSMFGKKVAEVKAPEETTTKIKTEEDLYNKTELDDDGREFEEASKRHIKPDNVVGIAVGFFSANDIDNQEARGTQITGAWAYQFSDNWFAEFVYARSQLEDFPAKGAQTLVNNVVGRLKFNFKAPLYSFLMPYVGFQSQTISSNAGDADNLSASEKDKELAAVDKLKKTGPVFGVTILRRLVPGWFIRADLGNDVLNAGVAIEF